MNCIPKLVHVPAEAIYKLTQKYTSGKVDIDDLKGKLMGDKLTNVSFDNSKIKSFVPGFEATIPFREGVHRVVEWFNEDSKRKTVGKVENELMDLMLQEWEQCLQDID